jgi:hypothetical protein
MVNGTGRCHGVAGMDAYLEHIEKKQFCTCFFGQRGGIFNGIVRGIGVICCNQYRFDGKIYLGDNVRL